MILNPTACLLVLTGATQSVRREGQVQQATLVVVLLYVEVRL